MELMENGTVPDGPFITYAEKTLPKLKKLNSKFVRVDYIPVINLSVMLGCLPWLTQY